MEALKTYTQEKSLAERVNDILAEIKMTKQELAMQLNISRSAVSQYLNGKYSSNPEAIEARLRDFVSSYDRGDDVVERPEAFLNRDSEVVGSVKPKIENFESTDYVQIIGVPELPGRYGTGNHCCKIRLRKDTCPAEICHHAASHLYRRK